MTDSKSALAIRSAIEKGEPVVDVSLDIVGSGTFVRAMLSTAAVVAVVDIGTGRDQSLQSGDFAGNVVNLRRC